MFRKFLATCALFSSLSFSVQAYTFVPPMNFFVNRDVATTRVFNSTAFPIVCSGQAFGQTYRGVVLNTWLSNVVIYPGQWADATVFSNYYDPFARAWAQIGCARAF